MIHWNLVEKRARNKSIDKINFEVDKMKLSFCDELINFGLKNEITDFELINVFKDLLGSHIRSIEDTFNECEQITAQLMQMFPNIPKDEACVNNRNIKVLHTNDGLEILFAYGFDKFLGMNIYGYIQLTKSKRKLYVEQTEVLWSKYDSILSFDYVSHFASIISQVDTLKTIEEINQYRSNVKDELFNCFRVTDYRKLFDYDEKENYEEMIRLARCIVISFRACDAKVKLISHGISADDPKLVDLIMERDKYDSLVEDKDYMIELLGEEKYENSIKISSQKIERLLCETKINSDELDQIMI
jgi:hypothetical protein